MSNYRKSHEIITSGISSCATINIIICYNYLDAVYNPSQSSREWTQKSSSYISCRYKENKSYIFEGNFVFKLDSVSLFAPIDRCFCSLSFALKRILCTSSKWGLVAYFVSSIHCWTFFCGPSIRFQSFSSKTLIQEQIVLSDQAMSLSSPLFSLVIWVDYRGRIDLKQQRFHLTTY